MFCVISLGISLFGLFDGVSVKVVDPGGFVRLLWDWTCLNVWWVWVLN